MKFLLPLFLLILSAPVQGMDENSLFKEQMAARAQTLEQRLGQQRRVEAATAEEHRELTDALDAYRGALPDNEQIARISSLAELSAELDVIDQICDVAAPALTEAKLCENAELVALVDQFRAKVATMLHLIAAKDNLSLSGGTTGTYHENLAYSLEIGRAIKRITLTLGLDGDLFKITGENGADVSDLAYDAALVAAQWGADYDEEAANERAIAALLAEDENQNYPVTSKPRK